MAINMDAYAAAALWSGAGGRPDSERLNGADRLTTGTADPFRRWLEQAADVQHLTPAMQRRLASVLASALDRAGMHAMLAGSDDTVVAQSGRFLMPATLTAEMLMELRSLPTSSLASPVLPPQRANAPSATRAVAPDSSAPLPAGEQASREERPYAALINAAAAEQGLDPQLIDRRRRADRERL